MLAGFVTLLAFQLLGELLQQSLHLPLPGPVIGMLLLFVSLCLRGTLSEGLNRASQGLIEHLPLLLMAPAAGIFFLGAQFSDQWPGFIAATVGGTLATLVFCALLLKALSKVSGRSTQRGDSQ